MRISLFIVLLSLSNHLLAGDCQIQVGGQKLKVKEGESVSLFSEGKPLASHHSQDQDGLATCYANVTSTALKTILPNNPDISYGHIAIKSSSNGFSSRGWEDGQGKYMNEVEVDGTKIQKSFVNYGSICESVEALKKSGGACPKSNSLFEKHESLPSDIQERLYNGLGKYFDTLNQIKENPQEFEKLKKDLQLTVEGLRFQKTQMEQECQERRDRKYPAETQIETNLSTVYLEASKKNDSCSKSLINIIKSMASPQSRFEGDRVEVKVSPAVLAAFQAEMDADPAYGQELSQFLGNKKFNHEAYEKLGKDLDSKIINFYKKFDPNGKLSSCTPPSGKSPLQSEYDKGESYVFEMHVAKKHPCNNFFEPGTINTSLVRERAVRNEKLQCVEATRMNDILNALMPLLEVGHALDDPLFAEMLNPVAAHANQLESVLMPGCKDKNKLIDMNDVTCENISFCSHNFVLAEGETFKYKGASPPNKNLYRCQIGAEANKVFRNEVIGGILEGRATPISVCTAFMDNPSARTEHCMKPAKVKGSKKTQGHAFHAMTVSGYRCKSGKVEYQVVNSWGSNDCPADPEEDGVTNKNKIIECELDEEKFRTGRFWIKEDALVDNTTHLSSIKKQASP